MNHVDIDPLSILPPRQYKNQPEYPGIGHCNVYQPMKQHYCKQYTVTTECYCIHHNTKSDHKQFKHKLICEYCTTLIQPYKYQSHILKCTAKQRIDTTQSQLYYVAGINTGDNYINNIRSMGHNDLPVDDRLNHVLQLKYKLDEIWRHLQLPRYEQFNISAGTTNNELYSKSSTKRHTVQNHALIDIMNEYGMIHQSNVIVEAGAGRAMLLNDIAHAYMNNNYDGVNDQILNLVAIDRDAHQNSADGQLLKNSTNIDITRCRIDLRDVVLHNIPIIEELRNTVVCAKHCCGVATDLTLRACINTNQHDTDVHGIFIATCCHHRCNYNDYCNPSNLTQHHITVNEFQLMLKLTSWYTCHFTKHNRQHGTTDSTINSLHNDIKRDIGWRCKYLIDLGRCNFLQQNGYRVQLVPFVSRDISLENICIVAIKNQAAT